MKKVEEKVDFSNLTHIERRKIVCKAFDEMLNKKMDFDQILKGLGMSLREIDYVKNNFTKVDDKIMKNIYDLTPQLHTTWEEFLCKVRKSRI